jgi:hypothetical protein
LKISDGKFVSENLFVFANQILQDFLSAANFPEWKWTFMYHKRKGKKPQENMNFDTC